MSRPDDSTVTIRATGSGPRFLALLEAAALLDGAVVHCGGAEPRSVEAAREELDAAHAALAPRRAEAAAAMRERTPAVAATLAALRKWGGTAQVAAEPEPVEWSWAWASSKLDVLGMSYKKLADLTGIDVERVYALLTSVASQRKEPTPDEARAIYAALGLGGAQ